MAKVLIMGDPADVHVRAVQRCLLELGCGVEIWQSQYLLYEQSLVFRPDIGSLTVKSSENELDFCSFDSVWFRRVGTVRALPAPERWIESFCQKESTRALQAMIRALPCFKVNDPRAQEEALLKLQQLQLAQECGFRVPQSLVTNSPAAIREFFELNNREVIYKLIDEATNAVLPNHHNPAGIFTTLLTEEDINEFDSVELALHLFQRRIPKKFDVRLTVIGEEIFGARIMSQSGRGHVDFRLDYSVPTERFDVSGKLRECTLALMERMGLVFGCIDLCVDSSDCPFFFEINPQGQFLWIEDAVGFPLSNQLALLLKTA